MKHHVVPVRIYFSVFGALIVLTALTVYASSVDLGPYNITVALAIAFGKAALVVLYFMHVRYGSNLTKIVVIAAFVWLVLLLVLAMSDFLTRSWLPVPQGWQ
jgi:cytochrome c oxidase subunit IV